MGKKLFKPNRVERLLQDEWNSNGKARVFARLHYWCATKPDGFYKFKQRCSHKLYRKGDSWGEELDMARRELDANFKELVHHHKSWTAYNKSIDKFGGKMFCSYTERRTNKTFYFMDKEAVEAFLSSLVPEIIPPVSSAQPTEVDIVSEAPKSLSSEASWNAHNEQPTRAHPDQYELQTNTSLTRSVPKDDGNPQAEEVKSISKNMLEIWNSILNDKVIWYPSSAERLCKVLKEFFKGSLETFKQYCLTLASSDFLMGKANNSRFKAYFWWAIKPFTIQMIKDGAYGIKSFFTIKSSEQGDIEAALKTIENALKNVDAQISQHEHEIRFAQAKQISEQKELLTSEEIDAWRVQSDEDFYEKYPQHKVINDKYSQSLLDIHFDGRDGFLNRKLREKLGFSDVIIIPEELIDKKDRLLREFQAKNHQLAEIKRKNNSWANRQNYGLKHPESYPDLAAQSCQAPTNSQLPSSLGQILSSFKASVSPPNKPLQHQA